MVSFFRACGLLYLKIRNRKQRPPSRYTNRNPEYQHFKIGDYTYGRPNVVYDKRHATLEIGKFCSIADDVVIMLGGEHRPDWTTTYPFYELFDRFKPYFPSMTKGHVIIGNDVWIGQAAVILSGVHIGDGAIIGAHSVVTKDVEAYAIVAGNPARTIRMRFNPQTVQAFLKMKWWDWPTERIFQNVAKLLGPPSLFLHHDS